MKGAAAGLLLLASILGALVLLVLILLNGLVWASVRVLPAFRWVNFVLLFACVFLFAPLAFFRRTRMVAGMGFVTAKYSFGVSTWLFGCVVTYGMWGKLGLTIGLCLGGVGVVPLGVLAAMLHGYWRGAAILSLGVVLTYAAAVIARYIGTMILKDDPVAALQLGRVAPEKRTSSPS